MVLDDDTHRLAHEAGRLEDAITERRALWADKGGRSIRDRYLGPHAESVTDLVALLRQRDVAIVEVAAALARVRVAINEADHPMRTGSPAFTAGEAGPGSS